jgi:hypothetical protein
VLAALICAIAVEAWVVAPRADIAAIIAAGVWSALPGVVLAREVFRRSDGSSLAAWLIGPALGFGFSVFGAFLMWAAGLQNWLSVVVGPGLTWALALAVRRIGAPRLRLPLLDRRDLVAVALSLFIVPLVTWLPYDHVREPVGDGEAYRAYFTADFVWATTVTAELAKGDVPPHNPYLRDQPMHYYWLSHFLSGAVYRNVASWGLRAEQVVLLNGMLFGLAFVAFFYGLARSVGGGAWTSLLAVAAGVLAASYEGTDMIRAIITHGDPWTELTTVNIDAVSRWFYKGMAVDGLHRLFLYQPHHLTGYMLALAALWLVALAEDVTQTFVALSAGTLLGLALLFSTFGAMIVGAAVGIAYAVKLAQQRALTTAWQSAILGAAPVAIGVGATSALGYTDARYGPLLELGLNPVATEQVFQVWFLSFGPLLFAGVAGLMRGRWALGQGIAPVSLVVAATGFYFLVNVPDSGDVWVGWRSGHMLLIAFAVMGAAALSAGWRWRMWRATIAFTVAAALLLALPTAIVDIYNAQDVTNRGPGPAFPWTLVVTPQERQALEWIRTSTPSDALVQAEPHARGATHWAFISAFAERRSVAGLPPSMIPMRPYQQATDEVALGIFEARSAPEAHEIARGLGIRYLVIGRPERRDHRAGVHVIASRPDLFPTAFRNDEVTIVKVE